MLGVLVSPAAAHAGLSAPYRDWEAVDCALLQLSVNAACIVLVGAVTLVVQGRLWAWRLRACCSSRGDKA